MASNKELMSDITALCVERGVAVPEGLEQLKNPKLLELLDSLRQAPLPSATPSPVAETALRPLVASPPEDAPDGAAETVTSGDTLVAPTLPVTDTETVQAPPPAAPPAAPAAVATGASGYYVAAGKTVSTLKREVQGAFQEVYASDFAEGQAQIDAFLALGYLFKR